MLSLTSCSSDDTTTSVVLLKKLQAGIMGDVDKYQFTYNGTKLTKISFEQYNGNTTTGYSQIVYTGDLITQVSDFNNNNVNTYNTVFTYNGTGQLTQVMKIQVGVDHAEKTVFTYNTDNTVNSDHYVGTIASQPYVNASEKFYFEGNNLIQKDYTYAGTFSSASKYNYDTANHPMKNVTGLAAIELYVNSWDGFLSLGLKGVSNNIIKETIYNSPGVVSETINFDSVYNDDNYPVSISSTVDSPGNYDYSYEYYN